MKIPSRFTLFLTALLCAAVATTAGCAGATPPAGELVLSASGYETALIVGDDWAATFGFDPSDTKRRIQGTDSGAHQLLQRYFKEVTGQGVVILKASQVATAAEREKYQTRIWCDRQPEVDRVLGDDFKNLDDDGFIIRAKGNDLYLSGKHWWGSVWAAYELLERFADCGWYGPSISEKESRLLGTGINGPLVVVPQRERIAVPADVNIVEEPTYKSRWFRLAPSMTFRLRERDEFHHNLLSIIPPDKYEKTHPEYFPIIGGKRWFPPVGRPFDFQPNVAAPGMVELVADAAIKYFDEHPAAGSFSLGMNDSDKFCDSEECLAAVPKSITNQKQRIAYSFFDFYNKVAARVNQKYPEKRLGLLAYNLLRALPENTLKLDPMLVPYLTVDSAQLFDKKATEGFQSQLDKWATLSSRMGVYEYAYGGGFLIPRIYNRYLMANVQRQYGTATDGFYAEAYPNWGLDGPKYWLLAKMLWNAKQDPKILLDGYYKNMFGSAADEMRQYFDYLEEVWVTQDLPSDRANYRWLRDPVQLKIFSLEKCDHAWALLQAASAKTTDKAALSRIKYFQNSFALTRTLSYSDAASDAADKAVSGNDVTLTKWLPELLQAVQLWQQAPALEKTVATVQTLQPSPLNSLSWDMLDRTAREPIGALQIASQRMNQDAVQSLQKDNQPLRRANITAHIDKTLAEYSKIAPGAVKQLQIIADEGAVVAPAIDKVPTIDGIIKADEWLQPIFDGHFFEFNTLKPQAEKSTVYAGWQDERLYLAFDLEQDPATVGGTLTGLDNGGWKKPEMLGDDAVVVNFTSSGHYLQGLRVSVNGALGLVDNQLGNEKWQSAVQAKARKTTSGWQVEMAIDMAKLQVPSAWLNKETLLMPMARYIRRASSHKDNEPVTYSPEVSTIVPAPGGAKSYPNGNFTSLMSFKDGPQLLFEKPAN